MNRKTVTILIVAASIAVIAVLATFVKIAPMADMVAALDTAGMTCGSCSTRISNLLKGEPGVASVSVNVEAGRVMVSYDSKATEPARLAACVTKAGFGSRVIGIMKAGDFTRMTGIPAHRLHLAAGGCGPGCGGR